MTHWADDGPTDVGNLVLVCSFHHRFVHDRGWSIEVRQDGRHRYRASDSAEAVAHTVALPGASAEAVARRVACPASDSGPGGSPGAAAALAPPGPHEPHGRFDLDTAVAVLLATYDGLDVAA